MNATTASNGALTAFLRGVERRGAVFAELQGGDPDRGDAALAATLRAFRSAAVRAPFAEWPRRFWSMLLASPLLRAAGALPPRADALAALAGIGSGPRAALLLRLVAGLSEGDAAAVLGVSRATYRMALQRALPRGTEGGVDAELWRAMGETAQQAVRALSPKRLARVAALQVGRPDPREKPLPASRPRWLWPAMVLVALLTTLALAATWLWPGALGADGDDVPRIRTEALPPADQPAGRYADDIALLTHRDLELLLDARSADAPPLDPAFDAWLVVALQDTTGQADAQD